MAELYAEANDALLVRRRHWLSNITKSYKVAGNH